MLKIRLRRTGKRNQPHYRMVVAEHTAPVTGKIVAQLGHYNPRTKDLVADGDEALRWMSEGAQPSNTVARLLLRHGLAHKALVVHTFKQRGPKKAAPEAAEQPAQSVEVVTEAASEKAKGSEEPAEAPAEEVVTESIAETESTKEEPVETPEQPTAENQA